MRLDHTHIAQINSAIRDATEKRRTLTTLVHASIQNTKRAQIAEIEAYEYLLDLLETMWPEIKERVESTLPSGLVFPRRDE